MKPRRARTRKPAAGPGIRALSPKQYPKVPLLQGHSFKHFFKDTRGRILGLNIVPQGDVLTLRMMRIRSRPIPRSTQLGVVTPAMAVQLKPGPNAGSARLELFSASRATQGPFMRLLLPEIHWQAKRMGFSRVEVEVHPAQRAFWKKLGFVPVKRPASPRAASRTVYYLGVH